MRCKLIFIYKNVNNVARYISAISHNTSGIELVYPNINAGIEGVNSLSTAFLIIEHFENSHRITSCAWRAHGGRDRYMYIQTRAYITRGRRAQQMRHWRPITLAQPFTIEFTITRHLSHAMHYRASWRIAFAPGRPLTTCLRPCASTREFVH